MLPYTHNLDIFQNLCRSFCYLLILQFRFLYRRFLDRLYSIRLCLMLPHQKFRLLGKKTAQIVYILDLLGTVLVLYFHIRHYIHIPEGNHCIVHLGFDCLFHSTHNHSLFQFYMQGIYLFLYHSILLVYMLVLAHHEILLGLDKGHNISLFR